eukprot:TRINITY_DN82338_c0_g1_i1.p1 TRINITY_DN82338_c0_g1~~TRINITY_DN82338_c0_g1_i1.p1  ORF type:complete len:305 (-),score=117.16 TRINITY_DN82338_c0_g1_i1:398-1312(-)
MPPKKSVKQEPSPEIPPVDVVEEEGNGVAQKDPLSIDDPEFAKQALELQSIEEIEKFVCENLGYENAERDMRETTQMEIISECLNLGKKNEWSCTVVSGFAKFVASIFRWIEAQETPISNEWMAEHLAKGIKELHSMEVEATEVGEEDDEEEAIKNPRLYPLDVLKTFSSFVLEKFGRNALLFYVLFHEERSRCVEEIHKLVEAPLRPYALNDMETEEEFKMRKQKEREEAQQEEEEARKRAQEEYEEMERRKQQERLERDPAYRKVQTLRDEMTKTMDERDKNLIDRLAAIEEAIAAAGSKKK